MKNIKLGFWGLLLVLTGLWLLADPLFSEPYQFLTMRAALVNYTGIIGIGVMSVGMILAARPVIFEPYLGGLDKMYRLHKWLGITGLVMAITHWLWTQAPKWLVALEWMERPVRSRGAEPTQAMFQFFHAQRGLAEGIGEWTFYAAVVLIALALVKRFPYRLFFKTHRVLAIAYLLLVVHGTMLMNFSYWGEVIGPLMAVLMTAGSAAALGILFGLVGRSRQVSGVIESVRDDQDIRVVEVNIRLKGNWRGHQAGQFVFVTFDEKEGPHPFTISSDWKDDGRMLFLIKGLGDYTRTLATTLKVGAGVTVEGPYGQFNFSGKQPHQIWVGGGIGITPFIARMKSLAERPDGRIVDLFHTTVDFDEEAIGKLRHDAAAAKVRLHVLVDAKDGRLNAERICQAVPDWKSSDIWFCGPAGFGDALRRDFRTKGLAAANFHQELFAMR
jgi:predicted ferric reductase